jgi:hypothetical protein
MFPAERYRIRSRKCGSSLGSMGKSVSHPKILQVATSNAASLARLPKNLIAQKSLGVDFGIKGSNSILDLWGKMVPTPNLENRQSEHKRGPMTNGSLGIGWRRTLQRTATSSASTILKLVTGNEVEIIMRRYRSGWQKAHCFLPKAGPVQDTGPRIRTSN